ncbi:hypothetical protein ACOBQX_04945 [Actinokineospora sp. G85]|uniref:hypothetical protein n=1 Tax=Actinokineospora sp. G85 TaxID=3406626 RepID=UPI003C73755B
MRLTRLPAAALAVVLTATACGGDDATAPTPTTAIGPAPVWTAVAPTGIPPDRLTEVQGGAGWDKGFALAGRHTVPAAPNDEGRVNDLVPDVATSPDGATWTTAALDGLVKVAHQTPVAGHRDAVYVAGATTGGAAVWRSEDGASWTRTLLTRSRPGEALSAVAAGPRGIVVAGFDRPMPVLDNDDIDNRDYDGLRVWHSADGKAFTGPHTVDIPGLRSGYLPNAAASADGFTLFGVHADSPDTIAFSSTNGTEWTADDPGSRRGRALTLTRRDDLSVMFTDPTTTDGDPGPTAWRHRTGEDDWTPSQDVTVGLLPDANIESPEKQRIRQLTTSRGWFVATGTSGAGGGVWLSQDAAHWERVPVKENGFDTVSNLTVLTNDTAIILADHTSSGDGLLKIWKAT